jgi:pimeloyl-ACP methyl ester carboxylesterase
VIQQDPARNHDAGTQPRPAGGLGITRFAHRGEQRLSYESVGAADGAVVLALHDLLADRGQVRPLAEALSPAMFRLTLPDARGHGASPLISGLAYPTSEFAADALAVLDAEAPGAAPVHVIAVGWAAATALRLAIDAPSRIASLTLVEPYLPSLLAHHPDPEAREIGARYLEVIAQAADAAAKGRTDRALELFMGLRLGDAWREGLPKARLGAMRRAVASLAPLLNGMASDRIDPDAARRFPSSMSVLRPENDDLGRWTAEALTRMLPQSVVHHETYPRATAALPPADPEWLPTLQSTLAAFRG